MTENSHCPDCGTLAGHPHNVDCDIERCSACGSQRIMCECSDHDPMSSVWTGLITVEDKPTVVESIATTKQNSKSRNRERLLVEVDKLYVHIFNTEVTDNLEKATRKFIRCFEAVWNSIPESDRKKLLEFWRTPRRCGEIDPSRSPMIFMGIAWAKAGHSKAGCRGGHEFGFDERWIERMKPIELRHVIAHELGHAMSYPNGWYNTHHCQVTGGEECLACECQAFSYMASWGFDPFLGDLPKGKRLCERFQKRLNS